MTFNNDSEDKSGHSRNFKHAIAILISTANEIYGVILGIFLTPTLLFIVHSLSNGNFKNIFLIKKLRVHAVLLTFRMLCSDILPKLYL